MEDERLAVPPQFILQKFDRDVLRGPSQSVQTGYIEDVGQGVMLKIQVFDDIRVMLTRGASTLANVPVKRCSMDLHAAKLILEVCRYRLNWTLCRRQGWYIMIHADPLAEMVIVEPIEVIPLEKPSWVTMWRSVPEWAMDFNLARVANGLAYDHSRQDVLALRDGP